MRRAPLVFSRDLFGNDSRVSFSDVGHWPQTQKTVAEELTALRAYMAKRDADPLHGWNPCRGTRCDCRPGRTQEHAVGRRLWKASLTPTVLRVVCAWCDVVLVEGDKPEPVSHGICEQCVSTKF